MDADRINYSYGMKLPGAEEYSSISVNLGMSTDVLPGETVAQAMDRARKFVQTQCEKDLNDIISLRRSSAKEEDEDEEVLPPSKRKKV